MCASNRSELLVWWKSMIIWLFLVFNVTDTLGTKQLFAFSHAKRSKEMIIRFQVISRVVVLSYLKCKSYREFGYDIVFLFLILESNRSVRFMHAYEEEIMILLLSCIPTNRFYYVQLKSHFSLSQMLLCHFLFCISICCSAYSYSFRLMNWKDSSKISLVIWEFMNYWNFKCRNTPRYSV